MKEEYICDKCNGTGKDPFFIMEDFTGKAINPNCDKCNGSGTLNWLENIFGKKPLPNFTNTFPSGNKSLLEGWVECNGQKLDVEKYKHFYDMFYCEYKTIVEL